VCVRKCEDLELKVNYSMHNDFIAVAYVSGTKARDALTFGRGAMINETTMTSQNQELKNLSL